MSTQTKLGIIVLLFLASLIVVSHLLQSKTDKILGVDLVKVLNIEFESEGTRALKKIVQDNLIGKEGVFAVSVESLVDPGQKYVWNEGEVMPAASLYKLILMAAVLKEVEGGQIKKEEVIVGDKEQLSQVLGGVDFGYEQSSNKISYTIDEALKRVATISDNFAAIMLTQKLRQLRLSRADGESSNEAKLLCCTNRLLVQMTKELGMESTNFDTDPIETTAYDITTFFRRLYNGQVVSESVSGEIIELLSKSRLNNRIPALLSEEVKVAHKTGELSGIRHDAGIVYPPEGDPYLIVLMGKDLKFEDEGVEAQAQISKEVFEYFNKSR